MSWLAASFAGLLDMLKIVPLIVFLAMGATILRHRDASLSRDGRLTRPGRAAGFAAGLAVIFGNQEDPVLAEMLPGFFDLRRVSASPRAVRRTNIAAGLALVCVGLAIPFL